MIVIVCVDDKYGVMYNHRRQSKDRVLQEHILNMVGSNKLWMNHYTKKQFVDTSLDSVNVIIDEDFLKKAGNGDYCFVEDKDISSYLDNIEKIILFKWNRIYPSDVFFKLDKNLWSLKESEDFAGHSHEKITKEIYER